jgi:uncharacterized membrane protein required for colicin V production
MLDLLLFVILIMGFFIGKRRGFILQLFHLTGYIIAYIAANLYCAELAPKLSLLIPYPDFGENSGLSLLAASSSMEKAFYRAIAFLIILIAVKMLLGIIARMLHFIAQFPILKQVNSLFGGILGFVEVYLLLFILLYIAALIPIAAVQDPLDHSVIAGLIVQHTPILSEQIKQLWIEYAASVRTSL